METNVKILKQRLKDHVCKLAMRLKHKPQNKLNSSEIINAIIVDIEKLNGVFDNYNTSELHAKDLIKISAEFLLENIGLLAGELSDQPDYSNDLLLATSKRNLYILNVARKAMAHLPITIQNNQLDYFLEQLVVEAKYGFKQHLMQPDIASNKSSVTKTPYLTVLEEKSAAIVTHIVSCGFKYPFFVYGKQLGCDLGIQGSFNFLVEVADESSKKANFSELELKLCHELDTEVKVFTIDSLRERYQVKIELRHINQIEMNKFNLEEVVTGNKYVKIFNEDRWSTIKLRDQKFITKTAFLKQKDLKQAFTYLLDEVITIQNSKRLMQTPIVETKLREKLDHYNKTKNDEDKINDNLQLANFIKVLNG